MRVVLINNKSKNHDVLDKFHLSTRFEVSRKFKTDQINQQTDLINYKSKKNEFIQKNNISVKKVVKIKDSQVISDIISNSNKVLIKIKKNNKESLDKIYKDYNELSDKQQMQIENIELVQQAQSNLHFKIIFENDDIVEGKSLEGVVKTEGKSGIILSKDNEENISMRKLDPDTKIDALEIVEKDYSNCTIVDSDDIDMSKNNMFSKVKNDCNGDIKNYYIENGSFVETSDYSLYIKSSNLE